ncbi:tetratricopeptide repeat protein [Luteimonas sp. MC1572]|uniref:tetratricopeptide repeat protein n=1 Tax=Luteimonas sp. MC1572 TaxID=2799325 RepID=UPI0018F0693A|nr:tetratricopeptide repeat protein [Luteimonas sp. MC1572]MBJ6980734.1 cytochrome C biogenesis protein [Luteimonas sp. MC1572]QQO02104.1 cytochrome C biogenesis protein [Luteimonas sp. MC1572]
MAIAFMLTLLLVALVATGFVALPLRRASPRAYAGVVAVVPVLALALYQILGNPAALEAPARSVAAAPAGATEAVDPAAFQAAVAELREALERDPDQPEGWQLLARSLKAQGDAEGANAAYAKALDLVPDDPALLVEAAQARAEAHPRKLFDDAAFALLQRAVAHQPRDQRARWFIGIAQRQRGLDAEAAATWEALLPDVDAATALSLRAQIDIARKAAGAAPGDTASAGGAAPSAGAPSTAGAASPGLRVKVSLDPDFAARVRLRGDATVFVMARAPDGPPMPVAAERHAIQDLPLDIVLDDADSPMPTSKLSQLREVVVTARLSASGTADRSADDIESAQVRVTLPTDDTVELVIGAAKK